ncbi:TadE/TadG family type IV pilus assembly protein [Mangrovicella endophytica]|uniref:TadE/TadG family type IV pilus assembly protein n=1 Tax=Mangrovicella endophytica TaxID=2066697 RepID=UPI000C9E416D|nr:TadE/TadG family type IV pilus assembly protein [Mangrovicella endophytica]
MSRFLTRMGLLGRFKSDRGANFATLFALTLMPLLGFAGIATDFAKATLVKRRVELAVDSANLAAINKAVSLINDGTASAQARSTGEAEGQRYLQAQTGFLLDASIVLPTITIKQDGSTLTSTTSYTADVPTVFARLFGKETYEISGTSSATASLAPFYDVYILVDVSSSMGIGATAADQDLLYAKTGCSLTCHVLQGSETVTSYTKGKAAGAVMRIDVVRTALQKVAAALLNTSDDHYRIQVVPFHTMAQPLGSLSSNLATLTSTINGVQLADDYGGTNMRVALDTMDKKIPTPGTGSTQATAKAILILMTDGVEDDEIRRKKGSGNPRDTNYVLYSPYSATSDCCGIVQSLNPAYCTAMKDRGIRLMAVNTKYLVPKKDGSNSKFVFVKNTLSKYIEANMKKCVTDPADYYDASSPADIEKAMADIASAIKKPIALTQ